MRAQPFCWVGSGRVSSTPVVEIERIAHLSLSTPFRRRELPPSDDVGGAAAYARGCFWVRAECALVFEILGPLYATTGIHDDLHDDVAAELLPAAFQRQHDTVVASADFFASSLDGRNQ